MRVGILTREFPPEVYGGAGVHVEYLSRELDRLEGVSVEVHCFGAPRDSPLVGGAYQPWDALTGAPGAEAGLASALGVVSVDLRMTQAAGGVDIAHSHTWYANLAGHLAKLAHGIPHVATAHSLEPLRPWKVEQLGGGYHVSSFCERTALEGADAVIAVSRAMADDVLSVYPAVPPERVEVIHNGIDPAEYQPGAGDEEALARHGIDPDRPMVMFIGRVTAQKGITHLLDAAAGIDPAAQLVLCAGAADTPEAGRAVRAHAEEVAARRGGVFWIEGMLPRREVVGLLGAATVFVCPSVYEPFGLINLEAMACAVPVVATAVGGIPEIVVDGETGYLVAFTPDSSGTGAPAAPAALAAGIAERVNTLVADPGAAKAMGEAGRRRVLDEFTWGVVAERTAALYRRLV